MTARALGPLALALAGLLAPSASGQVQGVDLIPILEQALGDDLPANPVAAEKDVFYAYWNLVQNWIQAPENLPADLDVLEQVRLLHECRSSRGLSQERFERMDWNETAFHLVRQGRYAEARDFLLLVIDSYLEESPFQALLAIDMANVSRVLEDRPRVDEYFGYAEEILERLDEEDLPEDERDPLRRAKILFQGQRARDLITRGLVDLATPYVARCMQAAEQYYDAGGDVSLFLDAQNVRFTHASALDRHEEILEWYETNQLQEALTKVHEGYPVRFFALAAATSRAYLEHFDPERPPRALAELRLLDAQADEGDSIFDRFACKTWVASCAMAAGSLDEAKAQLDAAGGLSDEMRSRDRTRLAALRTRLALLETDDPEALADHVPLIGGVFDEAVERWGSQGVLETGQGFTFFDEVNDLVVEYVRLLLAVHGVERGAGLALEELMRLQAVNSMARSLEAPEATLAKVSSLRGADHGFLVVLTGWTGSLALTSDLDGPRAFELPAWHVLEREREALQQAIEGGLFGDDPRFDGEDIARQARAVAAAFFTEELRGEITDWKSLTVVSVNSMGFLPFEMLPWEGVTFGERFALDYLPSFPLGLALAMRSPEQLASPAAFQATVLVPFGASSKEGELAFGRAERKLLFDGWPFPEAHEATGERASLKELGELKGSNALQIVAHGRRDPTSSRPYGLGLFDGALTPERADRLRVPELTVVLACQAWRGPLRRGDDGRDHLIGSFFLAGANTQVASNTRIDYHTGLALMREFYGELATGAAPAEALRRARVTLRGTETTTASRWTPSLLHVVGLGQRPLIGPP